MRHTYGSYGFVIDEMIDECVYLQEHYDENRSRLEELSQILIKYFKDCTTFRERVIARDGYKCRLCGSNIKIEAHHIFPRRDYPEWAGDINNGITLCEKCHQKNDMAGI